MEKLYDDFLYDCHIANQYLTEEDWEYYGKEVHHVEIPDCEGGSLTPLNSQSLTTYQHWIAGILQSEIVGRKCFAMVPAGVLPGFLETLRKKWQTWHNQTCDFPVQSKEFYSSLGKIGGSKNKGQKRGPHTDARKRKIAEKLRGQKRRPESIQKMRENYFDISGWCWVNNGSEETMVPPDRAPDEGWVLGRLPRSEQLKQKMSDRFKGEGNPMFGVTPKSKHMRWYKNLSLIAEKMFIPGEEPDGWVKGRLTLLDRRSSPLS